MKRTQVDPVEELISFASLADARMIPFTVLAFQCKRLIDNLGVLRQVMIKM